MDYQRELEYASLNSQQNTVYKFELQLYNNATMTRPALNYNALYSQYIKI